MVRCEKISYQDQIQATQILGNKVRIYPLMLNSIKPPIFEQQQTHILEVKAREILDSRGNPTLEVDITTELGVFRAAVPSGASTGYYEAIELRDEDKTRFSGKGVLKAIDNIHKIIAPYLIGKNPLQQETIDKFIVQTLDGTKNEYGWHKKKLGANAILAASLAIARAGATSAELPLYQYIAKLANSTQEKFIIPVPAFNVINGGKHAGNQLAFQEFMILPTGAENFKEALQIGSEIYQTLKKVIQQKYGQSAVNVGDEGGFAPDIQNSSEALELIMEAMRKTGYSDKVKIGIDAAASEFYLSESQKYDLDFKKEKNDSTHLYQSSDDLIIFYQDLVKNYPIASIEDPFDQDDFNSYAKLTESVSSKVQIVGDDLLVTNPIRIQSAIENKMCNALLLKINQIGTLTESIEALHLSQKNNWSVMVSHRSGETEDTFIADLVVGLGTGQIKTGAPARSERLAKYNQLLRIEEELGEKAIYAGKYFHQ